MLVCFCCMFCSQKEELYVTGASYGVDLGQFIGKFDIGLATDIAIGVCYHYAMHLSCAARCCAWARGAT